jgi:hypothetical protein
MAAAKRTRSRKGTSSSSKRGSGRRGTVKAKNATFYAKRTARGQFKEMDEKGRSLKADRRVKAKTKTKSGYGDRGDRTAEAVI